MKKLAPIVLFTYNRLFEIRQTIEALQKNHLAAESELYIFSDAPKKIEEEEKVNEVRLYIRTIEGFKNIQIIEARKNKGLANSIIAGVTEIIDKYGKVIVLEDDLVSSPNFLDFMNQALEFYSKSPDVISISGYTLDLPSLKNYNKDYYIGFRASSWGWATWKNRWENVDWGVSDYPEFRRNHKLRRKFSEIGSDMPGMLKDQQEAKIDSWAIRWCYHQFKQNSRTIFATKSKVNSIGITSDATHTEGAVKFNTILDEGLKRNFEFDTNLVENKNITKDFKSIFSVKKRAIDKLRRIFKI